MDKIWTNPDHIHSKKCWVVNPILGQIWTNPIVGLKKMQFINLTQQLGLSILDPKLG